MRLAFVLIILVSRDEFVDSCASINSWVQICTLLAGLAFRVKLHSLSDIMALIKCSSHTYYLPTHFQNLIFFFFQFRDSRLLCVRFAHSLSILDAATFRVYVEVIHLYVACV